MAIKLPELDDKTQADLLEEARNALPTIHPGWTDHNASDPGITLIELFAWLTEAIIYRTGRIPEQTERAFLRLLSGGKHGGDLEELGKATAATLGALRRRYRAVTPDDYEQLVLSSFSGSDQIARVFCVPERDLTALDKRAPAPGHISLIVLPKGANPWTAPSQALLESISAFFVERRVITTSFRVVPVTFVPITLDVAVHLRDDASPDTALMRTRIESAILARFDPLTGGPAHGGWPFGRDIDVSDVLAVIDDVPGVEFVDPDPLLLKLTGAHDALGSRRVETSVGKQLGLRLETHELPRFARETMAITLKERRGTTWQTIE